MRYTIGEVAEKLNIPNSTLRYYDKKGYYRLLIVIKQDDEGSRIMI